MKALIFAAGLGTRLYPLTRNCPKALVEVGGVPMLGRVIDRIKAAGATSVVVNVHHFADMIIDYLRANDNFGMDIRVSDERDLLLETGGGLLKARPLLEGDEPILIHNADIFTDLDLGRMQLADGCMASLLVSERKTSRQLVFDRTSRLLTGWINNSTGETRPQGFIYNPLTADARAFNGIHMVSPTVFPELERYSRLTWRKEFSITPFYLWCASDGMAIAGQSFDGYRWFDIGRPESLEAARNFVREQV